MNDLSAYTCLKDYEVAARAVLDAAAWAYLHRGAADEISFKRNESELQRILLSPQPMASMSGGSARLTLFGTEFESPILIAPVAYQRLAHAEGELATAAAANALKTGMVVSTLASIGLEQIASVANTPGNSSPLWFQLYFQAAREHTLSLVRRAETAGCQAVMLTIDAPINGLRNAEQRARFTLPPGIVAANLPQATAANPMTNLAAGQSLFNSPLMGTLPTWQDVEWLVSQTALPVLVKGIMDPLTATRALDAGAAGLIVSNHGGRVLDGVPATVEVLPRVVSAVRERVPVLMDGGIRRGTDVFKAIALGASAVLVGRPIIHGLAVGGAAGVAHVLHILRAEFEATMVLCGCKDLSSIDQAFLWQS